MRPISETIYGKLMGQGIGAGRTAIREAHGMKGPGAASDGARGGVAADAPGGTEHPPIGRQGGERPMGNSGKGRGPKPAPVQHREKRHTGLERGTTVNRTDALRLIVNPNMTGMAMRQTTQTPRAFAPRGVVSLMVIEGGKA